MKAYLFGWNPTKFPWEDLPKDKQKLEQTGELEDNWSVASHKTIEIGDRAYVVRVGVDPKGIFASGYISTKPYHAYRNGRSYFRIGIAIDTLLDPNSEQILSLEILKTGNLAAQTWTPQASGISIKPELVDELEGLWQSFLHDKD